MGFFDDLQSKASDMLGGVDLGGDIGADVQDQITQYAEDNGVSIEAAREHFLGGGEGGDQNA